MLAVRTVGALPEGGVTDNHPPPLCVLAAALNDSVPALVTKTMYVLVTLFPIVAVSLTVTVLGVCSARVGAASTVKLTGTTRVLLEVVELMVIEPLYGPGARLE